MTNLDTMSEESASCRIPAPRMGAHVGHSPRSVYQRALNRVRILAYFQQVSAKGVAQPRATWGAAGGLSQ